MYVIDSFYVDTSAINCHRELKSNISLHSKNDSEQSSIHLSNMVRRYLIKKKVQEYNSRFIKSTCYKNIKKNF